MGDKSISLRDIFCFLRKLCVLLFHYYNEIPEKNYLQRKEGFIWFTVLEGESPNIIM